MLHVEPEQRRDLPDTLPGGNYVGLHPDAGAENRDSSVAGDGAPTSRTSQRILGRHTKSSFGRICRTATTDASSLPRA